MPDDKDTFQAIESEIATWSLWKCGLVLSILWAKSEAKIAAAMAANPNFDHERYDRSESSDREDSERG